MNEYDAHDLQSVVLYMRRKFGLVIFQNPHQMSSVLGDLSPDLGADSNVLRQLGERGLLRKLEQSAVLGDSETQSREIMKIREFLLNYLFMTDTKADFYITVLRALYSMRPPVTTDASPKALPASPPPQSVFVSQSPPNLQTDGLFPPLRYNGLYGHGYAHNRNLHSFHRFFPNGRVASVSTFDGPLQAIGLLTSPYSQFSGNYTRNGNNILFRIHSNEGTIDYNGQILENALFLNWVDHINGNPSPGVTCNFFPTHG